MTIGYKTIGHGPRRVLALHGWFGDETTYDAMEMAIDKADFTFVCTAYRGYGASRHLTGSYSMDEIASDTLELADSLGWKTFSLVGHSMGGMAIQRILADAPERVEKLVAVTPVPAGGVPFDADTRALFESAAESIDARRGILNFSSGNRLASCWVEYMTQCSMESADKEAFAAYLFAWADTNFVAEIEGKTLPVKAIVGENDMSLTRDVMAATYGTWYPNCEIEVIANAGHYPMNEVPLYTATTIQEFLKR